MPRRLGRSAIGVLLLALLGCATTPPPTVQAPPAGTEQEIADAERLGRLILMHDVAAWRATDEVMRIGASPQSAPGVQGWITVPEADGMRVRFVGETDDRVLAYYDVTFSTQGVPTATRLVPPVPLLAEHMAAFRARQTALRDTPLECSDRYNTVAFKDPMAAGDDWIVYVIPATTVTGRVMAGRHHKLKVSEDGSRVLENRPLSKDCLAIDDSEIPAGAKRLALATTNLVTATPNESHVFLSLQSNLPFAVGTSLGAWMVSDGRIRYLGPTAR
jgi:hypothetical protein